MTSKNDTTDSTADVLYELIQELREEQREQREEATRTPSEKGRDYWRGVDHGLNLAEGIIHEKAGKQAAARLEAGQEEQP